MPLDYKKEYYRYQQYYLKGFQTLSGQPMAKASIGLIFSLLTISFFSLFAIKPTLTTIVTLIKEIKDQKTVDQALTKKINDLTKAQTAYQALESNIYLVENFLPKDPKFVRFVQELNYLAYKHTLIISAIDFNEFNLFGKSTLDTSKKQLAKKSEDGEETEKKQEKSKDNATKTSPEISKTEADEPIPIVFELAAIGQYQSLKEFVIDLKNLNRLMEIDSIEFSTKSETEGALKIKIAGKVFYFPD